MMTALRSTARRAVWLAGSLALFLSAGCGLADVGNDPTAVEEDEIASETGARMLRVRAVEALYSAHGDGVLFSALLSDELFADTPYPFVNLWELLDRRQSIQFEANSSSEDGATFEVWATARVEAAQALRRFRAHVPGTPALMAEMFALRGFATVSLAEHYCPGFALNEVVDGQPAYGPALTTDQVLEAALQELDSALVYGADSSRILNFARVGRARALLNLGRVAEAGVAAHDVPTEFVLNAEYQQSRPNPLYSFAGQYPVVSVANLEGGNGLNFVVATDPRVATTQSGTAGDAVTPMYAPAKYAGPDSPIVLTSGIEARLIEAEAAVAAGDPSWLTILNDLRATQIAPALAPLADPGTTDAQMDLVFRERAFWLYGTGHRLGDLRRLTARYGRSVDTVYPVGAYRLGGTFDIGTSIPFPSGKESVNPNVTGCTSR